ncbi:hypothetical protein [Pseudobutyrivibrio xylanivorans]|uniref:Uncharacterized protein n=1 Tax=Pseudobutyrivibrio xylanivorans TaxID=185007 RepID=A0A5P6VMH3_PSEXY|nr:hypothetical protein [Pseudobutyrivibrio xylanivorans]QFJ53853.1 hypothetical protein FXF36_02700 [Pseudobutyrivibrio xylanivorans]
MKFRSVQALFISLAALSLTGSISLKAKAQTVSDEDSVLSEQLNISEVIEHCYIPDTEGLQDNQQVSGLTVVPAEDDASHLAVTYDIVDAEGNVLRSVSADYGYVVDAETEQLQLYTRDLTYEYTNAEGQVVSISKEDAERLGGQVEVANYWTIDGYYVPTYLDEGRYVGKHSVLFYTRNGATKAGQEYVEDQYYGNPEIYKADVEFADDWGSLFWLPSLSYITTGTYSATYNKVEDMGGYWLLDEVKDDRYSSKEEAIRAAIMQARTYHGAYTIDADESRLVTEYIAEYAKVYQYYKNVGDAIWSESIPAIKEKLAKLKTPQTPEEEVQKEELEKQLEDAEKKYDEVQEIIQSIEENVPEVKEQVVSEEVAQESSVETKVEVKSEAVVSEPENKQSEEKQEQVEAEPEEIIEEELSEEIEEPEDKEERQVVIQSAHTDNGGSGDSGAAASGENTPVIEEPQDEAIDSVTITDEEAPLAVTMAGLIARGKWFAALGGASAAGAGVAVFEVKRRAAAKIIDKLNQ